MAHLHLITTDGGQTPDGSWHPVAVWDGERLMRLFRERLLGSLLDKRAISQELVQKLLAWRHPGFSAHVGEPIMASDRQRLLARSDPHAFRDFVAGFEARACTKLAPSAFLFE